MNNKLKLSALILGGALSLNAQTDTICTMVRETDAYKFNYYTSKWFDKFPFEDSLYIDVNKNEVLCLHLFTNKHDTRRVVTEYDDGRFYNSFLKAYNDVYFTNAVDPPKYVIVFKK